MKNFMMSLFLCSAAMSILALLYIAITPYLAKRYSAAGRYYAWLVIVLGLIIPFRPHFDNPVIKVPVPVRAAAPVIRAGGNAPIAAAISDSFSASPTGVSWWQAAALVWLAGAIVFLVYHGIRHYRFLKLTARWSRNITDERTLALMQGLKAQMGITCNLGFQICDIIGSPMLAGIAEPRILLPDMEIQEDELRFILKHELVHYKRKDIWYKCLVLLATAIHWFNPVIYLMAKAIDIQCELSCDGEVVRREDADMRLCYSEAIIGVVRYQSKLKTALSTNFYGGKKGMKERIFSIMDMGKKKSGVAILCGIAMLTMGTGAAFAVNAEAKTPEDMTKEGTMIGSQVSMAFIPDPDIYAVYSGFGLTISEDGTKLLYEGQSVGLFADEQAESWAFYLDGAGTLNLAAVRNASGEVTGIERISSQKAKEYQKKFFEEELSGNYAVTVQNEEKEQVEVQENVMEGENKYEEYQPFGVTYSAAENVLHYNGQRVKALVDQGADGWFTTFWTDEEGTVNLEVRRDASDQITGVRSISEEKAQEYQSASEKTEQAALDGLEEKVADRIEELYP